MVHFTQTCIVIQLSFCVLAQFSIQYIPDTITPPSERFSPVLGYSPTDDILMTYSGISSQTEENNLWTFSLYNNTWSSFTPQGSNAPTSRTLAGGFVSRYASKFYLFGGLTSSGILNDLWVFDLNSQVWTELSTVSPPIPLISFSYTSYADANENEYFVIYGGESAAYYENRIYILNVSSLVWTTFPVSDSDVYPVNAGGIEKFGDYLYYAGYYIYSNYSEGFFDQIWCFSLTSHKWDSKPVSGSITPRVFHKTALVDSYFYVIAGEAFDTQETTNEINRVNLSSTTLKWETLNVDSDPFVSEKFGLATNENYIFMFGGFVSTSNSFTNQLCMFDTQSQVFTTLSQDFVSPPARFYHSMNLMSGSFYVFGGRNSKQYFNDMWVFNPETSAWSIIQTTGSSPTARYAFAANSQGDALAIWGGQGQVAVLNDLYIFNSLTANWELLVPESNTLPKPAVGACLVVSIPKIYIYGGITATGYSGDLWEFNLWTNLYQQLSTDIELAYATCDIDTEYFYVIFGSEVDSYTQTSVRKFLFSNETWFTHMTINNPYYATIQAIQIFMITDVLKIGGQILNTNPTNDVYYFYGNGTQLRLGSITEYPYRSAYVYYKDSLYVFGGGEVIGPNLRQIIPTDRLFVISISEILNQENIEFQCSAGTYSNGTSCQVCSAGSYSEGISNDSCTNCTPGTYNANPGGTSNRQCYPCDNGFYNSDYGQTYCVNCPTGYSCPTGSSSPIDLLIQTYVQSIQPKIYDVQGVAAEIFTFQLTVGMGSLGVIIFLLLFNKTRDIIPNLDSYTELHNYIVDEPMYLRANKLGGFFTLVFLCLAVVLAGSQLISYTSNNIVEVKALVPKVVLDYEVENYVADELVVRVNFTRYGDNCSQSQIKIETQNIEGTSSRNSTALIESACVVEIDYSACTLSTGATITITSIEKLSYASGIYVNVTSSSSIPKQISSILSILSPSGNFVFIGTDPSLFYFTMTPSVFTDQDANKASGYHVSSQDLPVPGSEHDSQDLAIASQLKVIIYLNMDISGLYTSRSYIQTFNFLISSLIGSVFGVMGAVGGAMAFLEKQVLKYEMNKQKMKDLKKVLEKRKDIENEIEDQAEFVLKNHLGVAGDHSDNNVESGFSSRPL